MGTNVPEYSTGEQNRSKGDRIILKPGLYVVGRARECDVVVRDITVSRRHAEIYVTHRQIEVRDLGSRNGTCINGHPVSSAVVRNADRIQFGSVEFRIDGSPPVLTRCIQDEELSTAAHLPQDSLDKSSPTVVLTPALQRVLLHLLAGQTEKKIASKLGLSIHTVHNQIREIYRQYGVNSRAELLAQFVRRPG